MLPTSKRLSSLQLRSAVDQDEYDIALHQSGSNSAYFLHYHDYYEFVIYLGAFPATYQVAGRNYSITFGDIIICDLFDKHIFLFTQNDQHMRFSVGMSSNFVISCSAGKDNLLQIFSRNSNSYPILHIGAVEIHKYLNLIEAVQNCALKYGQIIYKRAILHQILAYLYDDFLHINGCTAIASTPQDKLVTELISYINLHLNNDLSLETLSRKTNYNATYLCRVFKNITHGTLTHYISEKRINSAILLMDKNYSLTEISVQVGFRNYSSFYKTFKKIVGTGPEGYYKTHHEEDGRIAF